MKSVFIVALACLASGVTAHPQVKPGFVQQGLRASAIDLQPDNETAPLIPNIMEGPEGGVQIVPQHAVEWKKSELPLVLQWLLAALWISMLASMPFIIKTVDGVPATKTQYVVGGTMMVVLFGGFFLFTNIILFQSIHFKTIRPLTVVECIYFMSQVITTVGYGDIGPAKIRGQVFVGLYVLGAMFVIAMLISDLTEHVVKAAKQYREKLAREKALCETTELGSSEPITVLRLVEPKKPSPNNLYIALGVFFALDAFWIAFFYLHPDEGKTLFQAVYMSVITLSTVGFGYFTPITEGGMIFGAFWMLFGSTALVNVITCFTDLMVKMNEWEAFRPDDKGIIMESLQSVTKSPSEVTESEFLQFTLLQMNLVNKDELDNVLEAFSHLGPKKGAISLKAVEDGLMTQKIMT